MKNKYGEKAEVSVYKLILSFQNNNKIETYEGYVLSDFRYFEYGNGHFPVYDVEGIIVNNDKISYLFGNKGIMTTNNEISFVLFSKDKRPLYFKTKYNNEDNSFYGTYNDYIFDGIDNPIKIESGYAKLKLEKTCKDYYKIIEARDELLKENNMLKSNLDRISYLDKPILYPFFFKDNSISSKRYFDKQKTKVNKKINGKYIVINK